jgi:O-antigen/teichoic acid export membrane protein
MMGGAASVGAGYLVLGGAGYLFLLIAQRQVADDAEVAALSSLYLLVNILGPGLFVAVEQETSRRVSAREARGEGTRPAVARLALVSAAWLAGVAVVLGALAPVLLDRVLNDDALLLTGLYVAAGGYSVAALLRGVFSGRRRFGLYGASVGTEGAFRLVSCMLLAAAGVTAGGAYGLLFALGPVASVIATGPWFRPGGDGPPAPFRPLVRGVGLLTVTWVIALAIANAAPVVVTALLPDDPRTAATFAFAVVLARIPLFVFQGAQSLVLPSFSRSASVGDLEGLRRNLRPALLLVAGVGAAALVVTAVAGGPLLRLAFGYRVGNGLMTLLMVSTVVVMAVQILQPALLALGGHRTVTLAWLAGGAVFAGCFLLPFAPVTDALLAQLTSAAVTGGILAAGVGRALRVPSPAPTPAGAGDRVG